MNVLGHVGLTLAATYSADQLLNTWRLRRRSGQGWSLPLVTLFSPGKYAIKQSRGLWAIDYRLVALGALLPDIIDKPMGFWLAPELVNQSLRSIGHTGAFGLLLLLVSLGTLGLRRGLGLLVLATSNMLHLVLDQMWQLPDVLLWPTRGWGFPQGTTTLSEWMMFHFRNLAASGPEVFGGVLLLAFTIDLYRRKGLLRFVRSGAIY